MLQPAGGALHPAGHLISHCPRVLLTCSLAHHTWIWQGEGSTAVIHLSIRMVSSLQIEQHCGTTDQSLHVRPQTWDLMTHFLTDMSSAYQRLCAGAHTAPSTGRGCFIWGRGFCGPWSWSSWLHSGFAIQSQIPQQVCARARWDIGTRHVCDRRNTKLAIESRYTGGQLEATLLSKIIMQSHSNWHHTHSTNNGHVNITTNTTSTW